jgi:hypothetical protein
MRGMTAAELRALPAPPSDLSDELVALWHDAHGDWNRAHETVQDVDTPDAAWVHAYLHRREGDQSNARYWYTRATQPVCRLSLDEEWAQIADALLQR